MLVLMTVVIMLIVAYANLREGIFTTFVMFINVLVAGVVAFNFWEPIADPLDSMLSGTFLAGFEDAMCLVGLFCLTLGVLRWLTNSLAPTEIEFPAPLLRGGSIALGLATGFLVSAFLSCVLQTLPWHEHFMNFHARNDPNEPSPLRALLPPDRIWLASMHRAGLGVLSRGKDEKGEDITFDRHGRFSISYERYRRYGDDREAMPDDGACPP